MKPRIDKLTSDLCREIDLLREALENAEADAEHWRKEHAKLTESVIANNEVMAGGLLVLALKNAEAAAA